MPPRYAYWTILIDNGPTAFRARDPEELLPTLNQLKRTNSNIVMKWFARGRLWDSPEAERAATRNPKQAEHRGPDWRPGGQHKDPRARPPRDVRRAKYAAQERTGGHWRDERRGDKRTATADGSQQPRRDRRTAGVRPAPHGKAGPANRRGQGYGGPPKRSAKAEAGRHDRRRPFGAGRHDRPESAGVERHNRPGPANDGPHTRPNQAQTRHQNRPGRADRFRQGYTGPPKRSAKAEARNHNRPGPSAGGEADGRKRRDDEPPDRG
jgi:hypothetical protein